jgi:NADH-quinone oxidoreductase subunit J
VKYVPKRTELVAGGVLCLALFAGLAMMLVGTAWGPGQPNADGFQVAQFGWALLTTYLVPFELASVLLLAVMIGAAYLARPERGE